MEGWYGSLVYAGIPVAYIVAEQDAALAIALVRQMTGSEVEDCGRVSADVLKFLKLKPGEAKALAPPHTSWTSKNSAQPPCSKDASRRLHGPERRKAMRGHSGFGP